MTTWFTGDHHFGHPRILELADRPFASLEEHDAALEAAWNERVQPGDTVWHMGDFALVSKKAEVEALLSRLNGVKHLIRGNHDHRQVRNAKGWASVERYREIKVPHPTTGEDQMISLFHVRQVDWHGEHRGSWALHGHSHGGLPRDLDHRTFDIGVDCWDFRPLSLEEVAAEMAKHRFVAQTHHGAGA